MGNTKGPCSVSAIRECIFLLRTLQCALENPAVNPTLEGAMKDREGAKMVGPGESALLQEVFDSLLELNGLFNAYEQGVTDEHEFLRLADVL
jgi:hypothetical protein